MLMLKAYQYRLYPTKAQVSTLNRTFDLCRKVYNNTLALRRDSWDYDQQSINLFETNKELKDWKQEYPELSTVYSQVLQNVQVRVDLAFKAFWQRVKHSAEGPGYPRFKGFNRYDSITYPQTGFSLDVQNQTIYASKIGKIKVILHRPFEGNIKTMTIRKTRVGKWYVSFVVEYEPEIREHNGEEITGIDLGLTTFAMLSNGEKIKNPRFFKTDQKRLARVQRQKEKLPKGSPERRKKRLIEARVHDRIVNRRKDFIHQVSRKLVDRFKLIAFEYLKIKNMQQNPHLAKSIADVAWGMMVQTTKNKAVEAGSQVVLVNPHNTSQLCSQCNRIVKKGLSDRVHSCPTCGLVMDRDQNAAINIMRLGLQSLPARARCL